MRTDASNRLKSYFEDIFRDRARLVRILLIILILCTAVLLRVHENSKADITVENSADTEVTEQICVDIGGAVVTPGVYTVSRDTRLYEVIEMAGGLLSSADTNSINRAAYVEDGEKIIIPVKPVPVDAEEGSDAASQEDAAGAGDAEVQTGELSSSSASGGLVNINYASKEELMTLTGIGEAKADKIIEYRNGSRFRKKEDIKSVNGIGDAVYDKIKDSITV